MVHNAHRRRSKPPIVRLRYPSLGESVMSFALDWQQTIKIAAQGCWRTIQNKTANSYIIEITI